MKFKDIIDIKPVFDSIARSMGIFQESTITYDEATITYDDVNTLYGGDDIFSDLGPTISIDNFTPQNGEVVDF